MLTYVDTSVLVAALVREPAGLRVRPWLAARKPGEFVISDWTSVELASALGLKVRMGQINEVDHRSAVRTWTQMLSRSLLREPLRASDYDAAVRLLQITALGLRSGDALHLAIVLRMGVALTTLDKVLASAAAAQGVEVVVP